jgi:hypothetical protein
MEIYVFYLALCLYFQPTTWTSLLFWWWDFFPSIWLFCEDKFFFIYIYILKFLFYFHCFAGWGYIVAFTEVLKIYQIYHIWIHPLHHSPSSPPTPISGIVSTGLIFHLHTCVHSICTIFTPRLPFPHLLPPPPVPASLLSKAGLVLSSCFKFYFYKM